MARTGTKVIVAGKEYRSIAELARTYNLPVSTVRRRMNKGWTTEQAVHLEKTEKKTTGQRLTVNGVTYSSRQKACVVLGIDPRKVHERLKAGRSLAEAYGFIDFQYRSKPKVFLIEGREFKSLVEACKFYGIGKYVLNARINRYGWTIEEGLGVKPRPGYEKGVAGLVYLVRHRITGKPYVGITMGTIEERWQQHIDKAFSGKRLASNSLHHAILTDSPDAFSIEVVAKAKNHGELCDQEVEYVKRYKSRDRGYNLNYGGGGNRTTGIAVIVGGKKFESITAACRHFRVDRRQTTQRINQGWLIEEAFGLVEKKDKFGPKPITINGIEYRSLQQAGKAYGVSADSISYKLKRGWSMDEIIGIVKRHNPYEVVFNGVYYSSESAFCKAYGVNRNVFRKRKLKGLSLEACLGFPTPTQTSGN